MNIIRVSCWKWIHKVFIDFSSRWLNLRKCILEGLAYATLNILSSFKPYPYFTMCTAHTLANGLITPTVGLELNILLKLVSRLTNSSW